MSVFDFSISDITNTDGTPAGLNPPVPTVYTYISYSLMDERGAEITNELDEPISLEGLIYAQGN